MTDGEFEGVIIKPIDVAPTKDGKKWANFIVEKVDLS
jgi:hypothetical protein